MTTTLRPTGPLQQGADGAKARTYDVCVNSRPVGSIGLATHEVFGPRVCRLHDLRIAEPDRGRGRGTVAALAAEEVARGWGCTRIETTVPADAAAALRLLTALGYVERSRRLTKPLTDPAPALPIGTEGRPMTEAEAGPWLVRAKELYASTWTDRGLSEDEARAKAENDHARALPRGLATPDTWLSVLIHDGVQVGTLWLSVLDGDAFVYDVAVHAEYRGHGHGRSLMHLAEAQGRAAGRDRIGLNVLADNAPALNLYASLGYEPASYYFCKPLL
ncbi:MULTISPECIES: GNAT family N-acetyltransferase [Streptomyces]|uniref:GNAT family N-acetyltransferase n=1 Tax=Streptomyces venezuelae TaxID=54571 RepID=A0A5P2B6J6_STRVZ|nr:MULTISPECIES: GNAT family N-acetyltransferase [Streptomyces]MYY84809.1 GNAT family N-acetyltransferase [Streptomyces sp. SID335]MYZ16915.1 GNAT family N-acetyltransferase [Streptomyces sp. SID337]NDZ91929.1 GNAT family N-acetyltransferase [Streptomyces sp. SID10115]NEB46496.1 GNAT family N-acetyltransferase [Streptomyces sp. SID339]QES26103.1 GNAT family N-acetyltransferase [Streptomyces venezuelae]